MSIEFSPTGLRCPAPTEQRAIGRADVRAVVTLTGFGQHRLAEAAGALILPPATVLRQLRGASTVGNQVTSRPPRRRQPRGRVAAREQFASAALASTSTFTNPS